MFSRLWFIVFLDYMLISSVSSVVVPDLIASFNMRGVQGKADFVMNNSGDVRIILDLMGFPVGTPYKWNIHSKGMLYDRENPCHDDFVGAIHPEGNLVDRHGRLQDGDFNTQYSDAAIKLTGPTAVEGRTLVFENDIDPTDRVCAQLVANKDLITAIATIDMPIAGHVILRQPREDPTAVTTMYMDVYDVVDPIEAYEYKWHISDNAGLNYDMTQTERCGLTNSAIYNPTGNGGTCDSSDPSTCNVGDLSGKFGNIQVQTVDGKTPFFFVDTNLPLTGSNSVIGKTLVFSDAQGTRVVCSQIRELKPKTVSVLFSAFEVSGNIVFKQSSPFDPTTITSKILNLRNIASGYHVHRFPVPLRYYEDDQLSSGQSVSGHFNPYGVDTTSPDYPLPGNGTNDQYEVGDMSGKFGTLAGLNNFSAEYVDWNMPLFGKNSIIGRSVIIHRAINAERWIYGTIGYPADEVNTLQAVFTSPIIGKIVLRQPKYDPLGDTSVWVEVARADGSATTMNHNWHIHQARVANDYLADEGRCSSTLGHDNPFNVILGETYSQCTPDDPGRCELGDLTGKLGTFDVPAVVGDVAGKYFWTDTRLPLSGAYSVASKSIVIHMPNRGAPRQACADLLEVPVASVKADMWTVGSVEGDIIIKQQFETDLTLVDSFLYGLNQQAGGWHVHNLPVPEGVAEPCSGASVQGHYNPFNVIGSPETGTLDMYEAGDLSGKFGSFAGLNNYQNKSLDSNLYLFGPRSVAGRSIVIHRNDDVGTRWVCATLQPELPGNAYTVIARAAFTTDSAIRGTIVFSQIHYGDDNYGETTIVVEAENLNEANSVEVDDTLSFDIRSGDEDCSPGGQIYNPYQVDTGDKYDDECDLRSQLRCQVGDLDGKHGEFSISRDKVVYTDINLPLGGRASVLGHNLLIHTSDDSYQCTSIVPHSDRGLIMIYSFPSDVEYDRTELDDALSDVELWNIISTLKPTLNQQKEGCQSITFYLIGPNQVGMLANFNEALRNDALGAYSPTPDCGAFYANAENVGGTASMMSSPLHLVLFTTLITSALYTLYPTH